MSDLAIKTLCFLLAPLLLVPLLAFVLVWLVIAWLMLPFAKVVRTGKSISFQYPW